MNYPIRFIPIFKERIWGSDRLRTVFGKDLPADKLIGESWEFVDLADDSNIAANGLLAGQSLGEIIKDHGINFGFTKEQCRRPFGLLIKFLDATDVLSVQVHPDSQACQTLPNARMKTECWYVLHAEADSVIYRGLKEGVGQADMEQALETGMVEQLLQVYPAKKGDFHFLPSGTVHAIGAGLIIAEIQTPSDTTYRLFDWNRTDASGNSRQLHIEEALVSTHFTDAPPPPSPEAAPLSTGQMELQKISEGLGDSTSLVDCPFFSVSHVSGVRRERYNFQNGVACVMMVLSGSGRITSGDCSAEPATFKKGDTLLLPTMREAILEVTEETEMLLSCLGPTKA